MINSQNNISGVFLKLDPDPRPPASENFLTESFGRHFWEIFMGDIFWVVFLAGYCKWEIFSHNWEIFSHKWEIFLQNGRYFYKMGDIFTKWEIFL